MAETQSNHSDDVRAHHCYRYAIYWAPAADSPLARLASEWLGRDAESGQIFELPKVDGLTESQFREVVRRPAHYGLHATLKAPFRLASSVSAQQLFDGVSDFVADQHAFTLPSFKLVCHNGFFYLQPEAKSEYINTLAAACVRDFDDLRSPLNDADIARRRIHELTDKQRDYVYQWGYPSVFDAYDMHLTLTSRIDDAMIETVRAALEERAHLWAQPARIDSISVFAQQTSQHNFRVIKRFAFSGAVD